MKSKYKKEESSVGTLVLLLLGLMLILSSQVFSDPPTPHPLNGRIFSDGGNGVPNGVAVRINNTNETTGPTFTEVFAPPLPQFRGSYAASIDGEDNDTIIVVSWNTTHFGENSTNLSDTTTTVNVVLEQLRSPETNVTIIYPVNDSLYNVSQTFNVTANISVVGASGTDCFANISFEGDAVNLSDGESHFVLYESLGIGTGTIQVWSVKSRTEGSVNITVTADCAGDNRRFETTGYSAVGNVTVQDLVVPNISLIAPVNDTVLNAINNLSRVSLFYNVTDHVAIANCSLIVNSTINMTNFSVDRGPDQVFIQDFPPGYYNWTVQCTDNASTNNAFTAPSRFFTVLEGIAPSVTAVQLTTPLDLTAGSTSLLECNATIHDDNNVSDIAQVNATFYLQSIGSDAPDDNNNHYTNGSCVALENGTYDSNYTCTMPIHYYASNGTWGCNVTVTDKSNLTGFLDGTGIVNELLAINVSPSFIDYGVLGVYNTSDPINMTVTNLGNVDFNISLDGYAQTDGDGLAMVCEKGNIPFNNHRFGINISQSFDNMTAITDTPEVVANFSLPHRTDDLDFGLSKNATYWRIQIPVSTLGSCNGTVIFRTYIG